MRRRRWPAAQSCRLPCHQVGALRRWQGNRHHCLSVIDGLCGQSVGKAEYRHAKALGFGSLTHRAGGAVASSVTMRPFLSRAFVKKSHIVTCQQFDGLLGQSVAKAEYRHCQDARCHHQLLRKDGSMSAVALGVGLGSLSHRAGIPVRPPLVRHSFGKIT